MTCGKLHIRSSHTLSYFLTSAELTCLNGNNSNRYQGTVKLDCTTQTKLINLTCTTQAIYNLVIERPRIAGGTLTIALDSTIKFVKCSYKDIKLNIIRLHYGSSRKCLVLRALSSIEREQWMTAIAASINHVTPPLTQKTALLLKKMRVNRCFKNSQLGLREQDVGAPKANAMSHTVNVASAAAKCSVSSNYASNVTTAAVKCTESSYSASIESRSAVHRKIATKFSHSQNATKAVRRVFCRNIPAIIQLFTSVGQIIAAAS
ncbi:hypothetical protein CCR75_007568 [Bremia lactucae]|uniref:PH domain-containing protein n=1 Tax=Bremia lactucae TaxID=4779 RepID=A0A976I9X2_BRELC|nr:hypothetical protein CCR75_007568 [Bremia lactucae]